MGCPRKEAGRALGPTPAKVANVVPECSQSRQGRGEELCLHMTAVLVVVVVKVRKLTASTKVEYCGAALPTCMLGLHMHERPGVSSQLRAELSRRTFTKLA